MYTHKINKKIIWNRDVFLAIKTSFYKCLLLSCSLKDLNCSITLRAKNICSTQSRITPPGQIAPRECDFKHIKKFQMSQQPGLSIHSIDKQDSVGCGLKMMNVNRMKYPLRGLFLLQLNRILVTGFSFQLVYSVSNVLLKLIKGSLEFTLQLLVFRYGFFAS